MWIAIVGLAKKGLPTADSCPEGPNVWVCVAQQKQMLWISFDASRPGRRGWYQQTDGLLI